MTLNEWSLLLSSLQVTVKRSASAQGGYKAYPVKIPFIAQTFKTTPFSSTCCHNFYMTYSLVLNMCSLYLAGFLIFHIQLEDLGLILTGGNWVLGNMWALPIHHSQGNPRCSPKNFYCLNEVATKSIFTFSKLSVCQKPFSTNINLSPSILTWYMKAMIHSLS